MGEKDGHVAIISHSDLGQGQGKQNKNKNSASPNSLLKNPTVLFWVFRKKLWEETKVIPNDHAPSGHDKWMHEREAADESL